MHRKSDSESESKRGQEDASPYKKLKQDKAAAPACHAVTRKALLVNRCHAGPDEDLNLRYLAYDPTFTATACHSVTKATLMGESESLS